ncbi:transmembrane protease serine 9-like [Daphnia carinata]|uniref:transmembrane protease serine 9-like n=1 Tax=Daphnia carinata TaxID=120202 RepID=UPI00257F62D6|nr:transmembrane protease serine 9-like [Daphnia carinata]
MLRVVWIACACTILASVVDSSAKSSRVVGGTDAISKQFPFVVQIQTKGEHRCAGYIYNANWIVTTAVCVYGFKLSDLKVVVGQVSLTATDPGEEYFDVVSNHIHESYDAATLRNNIAMLQLSRSITFDEYSRAVAHGELSISVTDGTLLGWGNSGSGNIASSLKYAIVQVVNDGTCPSIDPGLWDPTSMICAGDSIHNACYGDAGGPLVLGTSVSNYFVVGLVSHSTTCFSPTAYIRLSFYTAWMRGIGGETSPMPTTLSQTSTTTTTVTTEIVTSTSPATTTMSQTTTETTQTSNTNVDITTEATTTTAFFQTCNVASAGEFPFIVSVGDLLSGRHSCAGFIYNANYVVTTASCIAMLDKDAIVITAGTSRLNIPGAYYVYGAQQVITNTKGDIALIQTSRSFIFNENLNFIRFDQGNYNEPSSTVIGWASTEAGGCTTSLDLLWGAASLTSQTSNCEGLVSNFDAETMICVAGSTSRNYNSAAIVGSCRFENGAPLIQGMPSLVIGIKSIVEQSCATGQVFTVYTRISTFFDWLWISAGPQP